MRTLSILLSTSFLFLATHAASATVYITDDRGGRIGDYVDKYSQLYNSHEPVVISGMCASACTMVLALPRSQICATSRAWLGFHQAWDKGYAKLSDGRIVPNVIANRGATELLFQYYPRPVHTWINMHGGMAPPRKLLRLSGHELNKFVPPCQRAGTLPAIY